MKETKRANFGSKIGIVLATAGSAVGLGNVWRFPYMTGENGGAVFILFYLLCVLLLGIPCMISEFIIGRRGASNTFRAYEKVSGGNAWKYVGLLGVATGFLIMGYYCVVSGWCLQYIFGSVNGELNGDADYVQQYFADFSTSAWRPLIWTVLVLLITHFVIIKGVRNGIEKASKLLMPLLFILLLVIVVASCMLPDASKGIVFLFYPDFSKINSGVFLGALGQAFYSLSLAMGCVCTFASYFSRDTHLTKSAVQVSLVDSIVAILAGLMIFPAAFSVGISPDSGASLVFITLPNVFHNAFAGMPLLGNIVSFGFYSLLSVAAVTSLISLHEVSTAFLYEELRWSRAKAASCVTVACIVIGTCCSLSLGAHSGLDFCDRPLFDIFDFVTGQIFLPIGGFLTCVFLGWFVPRSTVYDEYTNGGTVRGTLFGVYFFLVRYVCPLSILLVFLHQFGVI